jgi:hypothetical protein
MIKPMLYGVLGFGLAASLAGAGYYTARVTNYGSSTSTLNRKPAETEEGEPSTPKMSANIAGVWALADSGCATGYGVGYSNDGRFSEGDEFSGTEGQWKISGQILIRETVLRYETDDDSNAPKAESVHQVDRFPISQLTDDRLTLVDGGKIFSYIKCPEGKRILLDGGRIQ